MTGSKQKFTRYLILICSLLLQITVRIFSQEPCVADQIAGYNATRLPYLAELREDLQQAMDEAMAQPGSVVLPRAIIRIPVVVHVVYIGFLENISDDQIQSQIDVLNEDFRMDNADISIIPPVFAPLAADAEIMFCLANRDPMGAPSSGITRRQTSWDNIGQQKAPDGRPRINYTDLGGEDAWDTGHYLNIWVARIGDNILGYGSFPGTAPPAEDGVVIDPRYFGRSGIAALYPPHHLGRTATHEIGHYFNLRHIWGGNNNTCNDDDDVADTPVQRGAYSGCPVHPQLSCGNTAMFMNFMDYTDDACMAMFTAGQKARMRAALMVARSGLMSDDIPCAISPVATPDAPSGFRLSPNPATSMLVIQPEFPTDQTIQVIICNTLGQTRYSLSLSIDRKEQSYTVDISDLPAGTYYAVLSNGHSLRTIPFVKL